MLCGWLRSTPCKVTLLQLLRYNSNRNNSSSHSGISGQNFFIQKHDRCKFLPLRIPWENYSSDTHFRYHLHDVIQPSLPCIIVTPSRCAAIADPADYWSPYWWVEAPIPWDRRLLPNWNYIVDIWFDCEHISGMKIPVFLSSRGFLLLPRCNHGTFPIHFFAMGK